MFIVVRCYTVFCFISDLCPDLFMLYSRQPSWSASFQFAVCSYGIHNVPSLVLTGTGYYITSTGRSKISVSKNFFLCWLNEMCMYTLASKIKMWLRSFWLEDLGINCIFSSIKGIFPIFLLNNNAQQGIFQWLCHVGDLWSCISTNKHITQTLQIVNAESTLVQVFPQ